MANFFAQKLIAWHLSNPRPLPWSDHPPDPYFIWLSEIIMQQTRIEQGAAYYHRFVERFPVVADLASAAPDEVMRLWQGLGYYSRARNLHKTAKIVSEQHHNVFPDSYDELLSLPGIGPYSAAAISSFAYGHRHVVVDGNVKRVISRFAGITKSIDDTKTHEEIRKIAFGFMKDASSALFNQAIMNFGALVCRPGIPDCMTCPLNKKCVAFKNDLVDVIPVRSKKAAVKHRFLHFILLHSPDSILMQRRSGKDIWKGLYSLPSIERKSVRPVGKKFLFSFLETVFTTDSVSGSGPPSDVYSQTLSHQIIHGRFYVLRIKKLSAIKDDQYIWIKKKSLDAVGKPKMIVDYLADFDL